MATATLESAIPAHLQTTRTCPARMPAADYQPSFPAYCARFNPLVKDIVIAILGAQHNSVADARDASALKKLLSFVKVDCGKNSPKHWDIASVKDASGAYNEIAMVYWDSLASFEAWRTRSGYQAWWESLDARAEKHGWFQEILLPSIDRAETIYSDVNPESTINGHGHMFESMSGLIREHVYWGSMRDRIPISQIDELAGEPASLQQRPEQEAEMNPRQNRVKVPGKHNLCVIRSGQDWSRTTPAERSLYVNTMHPTLIRGMNFLRDHGDKTGCYSAHLWQVLDLETLDPDTVTDRTFGLAYFASISDLESWSASHKTHLDIFHGFLKYAADLNFELSLHLYHEVMVLRADQQIFEYIGCREGTGMMGN